MGVTKTEHFTNKQNELSTLLKALAHPARIAIIEYLLTVNTCICGDIVNELPLAQPTISQHLKELKNANLIKGEVEGTAICYCINEDTFEQLAGFINGFLAEIKNKNTNCC